MWDLTSGKLLRTLTDVHSPGVAVLSVRFTDDKTVAVMSDSGGSVFALEFKRLIGLRTCDSRCLFSGSRGEVGPLTAHDIRRRSFHYHMAAVCNLAAGRGAGRCVTVST